MRYRGTEKLGRGLALQGSKKRVDGLRRWTEWQHIFVAPGMIVDTEYNLDTWVHDGYLMALPDVVVAPVVAPKPEPVAPPVVPVVVPEAQVKVADAEPAVEPEPIAEPIVEEPVVAPVAEPIAPPVAEPVAAPVPEEAVEPVKEEKKTIRVAKKKGK